MARFLLIKFSKHTKYKHSTKTGLKKPFFYFLIRSLTIINISFNNKFNSFIMETPIICDPDVVCPEI